MRRYWKWAALAVVTVLVLGWLVAWFWSVEPDSIDVPALVKEQAQEQQVEPVTGYATTLTMETILKQLLNKRGGYLSNDIMPPGIFMDNMPAWEFGVLEELRDLSLVMRKDFSRSQSQSDEDPDLIEVQNKLNIDHTSWAFPSAEDSYDTAREALARYRQRLADPDDRSARFYARADNLRQWTEMISKQLGAMSQRLSASVGRERLNTRLGPLKADEVEDEGDRVKTSWWKIDDVFYQSRGGCWALLQLLKAAEIDFADVLEKKNATVSLRQIIRELEATQQTMWSPMVLNGTGFGFVANHSLVMANYISRANAAVINLSELLSQG